jgi:hypothetical protein
MKVGTKERKEKRRQERTKEEIESVNFQCKSGRDGRNVIDRSCSFQTYGRKEGRETFL